MPLSSMISPHLPYLRRFARALVGTQAGGDAYALAALQALTQEPPPFPEGEAMRIRLYHLLLRVWAKTPAKDLAPESAGQGTGDAARHSLDALTPRSRIAFLLTAVDGFSIPQVGEVLGCSADAASELVATAQEELARQMATDVLIIEDEPLIAMELESLVESQGHRVIGLAATRGEAMELVRQQRPGLVLSDIHLADGSSGLDAVNDILKSFEVPVIFITAYPEALLTGERPEPAFLMTKPFRPEALKAIMGQALFFSGAEAPVA
jgi:CheY-like chemotaxis protein